MLLVFEWTICFPLLTYFTCSFKTALEPYILSIVYVYSGVLPSPFFPLLLLLVLCCLSSSDKFHFLFFNRCSGIYYIHYSEWHVICGRMGAELLHIKMEHAPVGILSACLSSVLYMIKYFYPFHTNTWLHTPLPPPRKKKVIIRRRK